MMKHLIVNGFKIFFVCLLLSSLTSIASAGSDNAHPRKIVVFSETFVNQPAQAALVKKFGVTAIKQLPAINGSAVYLPPQAKASLLADPNVLRIDDDLIINATGKPSKPSKPGKPSNPQPDEVLPWGIDRINAELAWQTTAGSAVKVAILDTGIDLNHSDLKDNIKGNFNAINPRKSGQDDNGHGTHVAGIVASVNNDIGVIGAAPEAYLYAVKVLKSDGSGWLSDLIEGLGWCINNQMQIVNMSLGSSGDNQSFHDAITAAYNAGIILVAAAGNNGTVGGAIDYPGRYQETITVSAIDQNDMLSYFSSYGPEVDLAAPGSDIYSTYKDTDYEYLSGTSMATPHVTGIAALVCATEIDPSYDINTNSIWDPNEVKNKLQDTAESLGLNSYEQGAGLVRADISVQ